MRGPRRVVIVQRTLRAYRRPFYDGLRPALDARGIALELLHTTPAERVQAEPDAVPPWAEEVPSRTLAVRDRQLVWQSFLRRVRGADLVVVEQAVQLLTTYPLLAWQRLGGPPVAFWGHGRSFHRRSGGGPVEAVKARVTREAHWFFAYNDLAVDAVRELGLPPARITDVRNTTDTAALRAAVETVAPETTAAARRELGLTGQHVCAFLGRVDHAKRLGFLLEAADAVRRAVPDFELVVVGDGPALGDLEDAVGDRGWVRFAGARTGTDLAAILRSTQLILVPGWAGLVIVDGFAAGVPLVASGSAVHPPEIAYLVDGENGRLIADGGHPDRYADAVVALLVDPEARDRLAAGARRAADDLGIEGMVARFAAGIEQALAAPRRIGTRPR